MKQVIQNFKSGMLYVDDVPLPALSEGMVLVENKFSLISAGTERGTVKVAQANLLNKAKQRPDLVAQVLQNIKKEGLSATWQKIQTKLDSLKALGYSTSGTVLSSLDTNMNFKVGDRVACAGMDYASHAEIVAVPQNLVAKIPDNVSFEQAAFTTLGAIALQGVRQADPKLGEKVCVIGLGLLGQLTCQLLKANGCVVLGIDLADSYVQLANQFSADLAINRNDTNLISTCNIFTNGNGFDAVIITAAAQSNDPVELAGEISKKKGKVIIVGAVKMNLPRDPHFYRKELELKMSCSYGPGRYDIEYEEKGLDYPFAYVRWTEQRNMQAFLDLLSQRKLNLEPLTTHIFDIAEAEKAYDIILGKTPEKHIGILLKYSENSSKSRSLINMHNQPLQKLNVGFIGAGSFAQSYLIPNVKSFGASLDIVVTSRGITAKNVANKFAFNSCSSSADDIFNNSSINTIFIATPHSSHANLAIAAMESEKNVFIEKPLAMNYHELQSVIDAKKKYNKSLMVGYNRRFAEISRRIKREFEGLMEPLVINMRINAGFIPKDHWIQQMDIGGGRIVGEVCHFIDLMQFFSDSEPVKVFAECIDSKNEQITPSDNVSIIIKFANGSVGNLTYLANGDKGMPKELIEVFGGGKIACINDFRDGHFYLNSKVVKLKSNGKGHKDEIENFFDSLMKGGDSPISFRSLCLTSITTFKILDSLNTGNPQTIEFND